MNARFDTSTTDRLVLASIMPKPSRVARIIAATAEASGLTAKDLLGPSKAHVVSHPRQVAMVLCRQITGASLPTIGRMFKRHHTTVLHAEAAVAERMTPELAKAMARIRERVNAP